MECDERRHAREILQIFNHEIATSTSIYEYQPRTTDDMRAWFADRRGGGAPVLGLLAPDGRLAGFGTFGVFRAKPAYKYTVEHSIYVHREHRGRGAGRRLLAELIAAAQARGVHVMVGAIDAANGASIALHEAAGFRHAGTIAEAGFKFGRWLDLALYQLVLEGPEEPVDG
ncbi:MAG: N-acetyltransferase [Gammaproteobacteria bacterium]|nr:N-acetyltransferase [Gammaproteobacteria bacterium]